MGLSRNSLPHNSVKCFAQTNAVYDMKPTSTLVQTDRFSAAWSEVPDKDPPPGRDFANALHNRLIRAGATSSLSSVPGDWWEHCGWYFFVGWEGKEHQINIECHPRDSVPPTWLVGVSRCLGIFKSLFGRRERRFEIQDSFLRVIETSLIEIASLQSVRWMTEDEAIDAFLQS